MPKGTEILPDYTCLPFCGQPFKTGRKAGVDSATNRLRLEYETHSKIEAALEAEGTDPKQIVLSPLCHGSLMYHPPGHEDWIVTRFVATVYMSDYARLLHRASHPATR